MRCLPKLGEADAVAGCLPSEIPRAIRQSGPSLGSPRANKRIEAEKGANPFLNGVPAILEALRSGQIECRVYDKD